VDSDLKDDIQRYSWTSWDVGKNKALPNLMAVRPYNMNGNSQDYSNNLVQLISNYLR